METWPKSLDDAADAASTAGGGPGLRLLPWDTLLPGDGRGEMERAEREGEAGAG